LVFGTKNNMYVYTIQLDFGWECSSSMGCFESKQSNNMCSNSDSTVLSSMEYITPACRYLNKVLRVTKKKKIWS